MAGNGFLSKTPSGSFHVKIKKDLVHDEILSRAFPLDPCFSVHAPIV